MTHICVHIFHFPGFYVNLTLVGEHSIVSKIHTIVYTRSLSGLGFRSEKSVDTDRILVSIVSKRCFEFEVFHK